MKSLKELAEEFLSKNRIAVAGVSRSGHAVGNAIFKKLYETGHEVFPVNPNASYVEGFKCYPSLSQLPVHVEAVVIATGPQVAPDIIKECGKLGIKWAWIHKSFGQGSYSKEAVELTKEMGINMITGSCPLMFCKPVDFGHKCIRWYMHFTRNEPKKSIWYN
jgi:acyl-CoA synthetase (NDP forming)